MIKGDASLNWRRTAPHRRAARTRIDTMPRRKIDGRDPRRKTDRPYTLTRKGLEQRREAAACSTGPRSDFGKRRSALNGVRHGLDSLAEVVPGESRDEFDRRVAIFADGLGAETPLELKYAYDAALASWRYDRLVRVHTAGLAAQVHAAPAALEAERRRELDELTARIDAEPQVASRLREFPQGCRWLIEQWTQIGDTIRLAGGIWASQHRRGMVLTGKHPGDIFADLDAWEWTSLFLGFYVREDSGAESTPGVMREFLMAERPATIPEGE
jgi:hypothetical protein